MLVPSGAGRTRTNQRPKRTTTLMLAQTYVSPDHYNARQRDLHIIRTQRHRGSLFSTPQSVFYGIHHQNLLGEEDASSYSSCDRA